jgi:hypothetical protein
MKRLRSLLLAGVALVIGAPVLFGETVKDREGAVRQDRASLENDRRWIYNDFARGLAEAKKTGRPLLVVLRCVPCKACMGIDAQVVLPEGELGALLDRFVCVRLINANALDLALFQFDYDLSFSTLFFNGDGTIYGRYGSWKHQRDSQDQTTASFRHALEGALAIHAGYPANRASLAGKQGGPMPFHTPVEIPSLAGKYRTELDWGGKVVQSCVHCHQVGDAIRASYRDKKEGVPEEWIYPFPAPETVGLSLAPDEVAHVDAVAAGSIAAQAGVKPGDDLVTLAGQPLISIADVSWAFQRAPGAGNLAAEVRRGGEVKKLTLALPDGWRRKADISKRVGTWPMRGMALGGMVLEDLPDEERVARGLDKGSLALLTKFVGQFGPHAAAKNAGIQKGDVIVSIDGQSARATESEMIGRLMMGHAKGDRVKLAVLRGGERREIELPMQ